MNLTYNETPFKEVECADVHSIRRREILEDVPEIRALMGYDLREFWITFGIILFQIVVAAVIGYFFHDFSTDWWKILLLAFFGGSIFNHWCGMAMHECSHDLMAPKKWQNKVISIMANVPMLVPISMSYRAEHFKHHTNIGEEGIDRDFPTYFEVNFIGSSPVKKFFWLLLNIFFLVIPRSKRVVLDKWVIGNVLTIIITDILILWLLGPMALFYLFFSTFFGFGIHPCAAHFIHEHYVTHEGQETYSYYGPFNLVGFNIGYHNEHHDWMNIPGIRLPRYRKMTKKHYKGLEECNSWTLAILHFISSDKLSLKDRYVRKNRKNTSLRQTG